MFIQPLPQPLGGRMVIRIAYCPVLGWHVQSSCSATKKLDPLGGEVHPCVAAK